MQETRGGMALRGAGGPRRTLKIAFSIRLIHWIPQEIH